MADKRSHNAKMNAKGLDAAVTEEQARAWCGKSGIRALLLVEVHSGPMTRDEDNTRTVNMIADSVEVIPAELEQTMRDLQTGLYARRPDAIGQGTVPGTAGSDTAVEDAAAAIDSSLQRDEKGKVVGIWEGAQDGAPAPAADGETCEYPGCVLPPHEEGDHNVPEGVTT